MVYCNCSQTICNPRLHPVKNSEIICQKKSIVSLVPTMLFFCLRGPDTLSHPLKGPPPTGKRGRSEAGERKNRSAGRSSYIILYHRIFLHRSQKALHLLLDSWARNSRTIPIPSIHAEDRWAEPKKHRRGGARSNGAAAGEYGRPVRWIDRLCCFSDRLGLGFTCNSQKVFLFNFNSKKLNNAITLF